MAGETNGLFPTTRACKASDRASSVAYNAGVLGMTTMLNTGALARILGEAGGAIASRHSERANCRGCYGGGGNSRCSAFAAEATS